MDLSVKTYSVKGISGDIYDFFLVDRGKWLFCMAEVMEKGIASSMMLVILRTLIRILVRPGQDPAELLTVLLRNFTETTGMMTAIHINLCLMEPDRNRFSYCGTENQKILFHKSSTDSHKLIEAPVPVKGNYQSFKGEMEHRDSLVLMTDGFYDALNADGKSYGWNSVMQILKKYPDRSSSWLQEALVKDIRYFEKEQSDDRTMFIARFKESEK
jgi:sigma-B regulation protein RsbU (phosphoserine phosphatase)